MQTYEIGPFNFVGSSVLPGGGIVTGMPSDPTWNMLLGPGKHTFYIADTGGTITDFNTVSDWAVIAAKGWKRQ